MSNEIERKFLIKEMPNLDGLTRSWLERHFLFVANGIELRIQTNGTKYTLERKVSKSAMERETQKVEISQAEFDYLKAIAIRSISRDSYHLADEPKTDLRFYKDGFEGLVRVEFEFANADEAQAFEPPSWTGREITDTPLARDNELSNLSQEQFSALLG